MRPILKQIATLIGSSLREGLAPLRAKQSALEARIKALEAAAGIEHKSCSCSTEDGPPEVGEVRTVGDMTFKCVEVEVDGKPRWRCVV